MWKQQVDSTIRGYKLQKYILGAHAVPRKFNSPEDEASKSFSEEYLAWVQQDQLLMYGLLSSMTKPILTRMVGCNHSYEIWGKNRNTFCLSD